ncbi:hypothetical protein PVAP13_2KG009264 [Panicum virgatum]|uniref:Uncharacterized protein n=1 Tax=Panicum virgatum TaxID=38727 RepID=A0A8T0VYH5_PANVG|nr:hypothetical protein PVAP13_2KG009264 [Panicum virgatum]
MAGEHPLPLGSRGSDVRSASSSPWMACGFLFLFTMAGGARSGRHGGQQPRIWRPLLLPLGAPSSSARHRWTGRGGASGRRGPSVDGAEFPHGWGRAPSPRAPSLMPPLVWKMAG